MAYFAFRDKRIYFETHGTGAPILILNGIMMSCISWYPFVETLSKENQLVLVDFLDQGKSDKMDEAYEQSIQADLVEALLDHLQIEKVNLMGISYGGEVAMDFAIRYASRVEKLMLFNTTAETGPWLRDIGDAWNMTADDAEGYYLTTIPVVYSPGFYKTHYDWMVGRRDLLHQIFSYKPFMDAMVRLTNSSAQMDLTAGLPNITAQTLVVSAQEDYLTPLKEQERIVAAIPGAQHIVIPSCGHASMYEQPVLFASLVLGFVRTPRTLPVLE